MEVLVDWTRCVGGRTMNDPQSTVPRTGTNGLKSALAQSIFATLSLFSGLIWIVNKKSF